MGVVSGGTAGQFLTKVDGTNYNTQWTSLGILTLGSGLTGGSYNGSGPVTVTIDSTVATLTGTQTLTNKRVTPRVLALSTNAVNPVINTDACDFVDITNQSSSIASFTAGLSGTPTDGQKLWIAITATTTIGIVWGSAFESSTVNLPLATISTNRLDVGFVWNAATSKWRCVGTA